LAVLRIQLNEPGPFIHGTNRQVAVGAAVSHGCMRLYDDHIFELATSLPNGTMVRIVRQPYKVSWHTGKRYLESHCRTGRGVTEAIEAIVRRVGEGDSDRVDWTKVLVVARSGSGCPATSQKVRECPSQ
jgi:hypothetical protein